MRTPINPTNEAKLALQLAARVRRRLVYVAKQQGDAWFPDDEWRATSKSYAELLKVVFSRETALKDSQEKPVSDEEFRLVREYLLKQATPEELAKAMAAVGDS